MADIEGYVIIRGKDYLTRNRTWMPLSDTTLGWVHTLKDLQAIALDVPHLIDFPDEAVEAVYNSDTEMVITREATNFSEAMTFLTWVQEVTDL